MNNNRILKNIHIQFFKSIGNTIIEIPDLAVFVGKNASGKSNIVSVFKFLRDLTENEFSSAMQQQGGWDILFNTFANIEDSIELKIHFDFQEPSPFGYNLHPNSKKSQKPDPTYYYGVVFGIEHIIKIRKKGLEYFIEEFFNVKASFKDDKPYADVNIIREELEKLASENWQEETINVSSRDSMDYIFYSFLRPNQESEEAYFVNFTDRTNKKNSDKPFKKQSLISTEPIFGNGIKKYYSSIGIFDLIPKSIKSAVHTTGNATLDEDGGNINIILQNILQDEEKRRTFMNLVRYVLPFIDDVEIDVPRNGLAMPVIRENYSDKFRLPAEFFSDGTATVIAIIVALFFEENSIVVIEEPERYVHPAIMDKLATLFEDAARTKKVVVTTHSPDLIRHLKPEHVQLVSRDKNHFTQIRRVTEDEEIKSFLAGEMQLDDLLVNNFFED